MKVTCPTCKRRIRIGRKGRCECGQALCAAKGRVIKVNEWPQGCLKLSAAETLESPQPRPAAPRRKRRSSANVPQAAAQVLRDAGKALHCKEIMSRMLASGIWQTSGKTPDATLYSAILRDIRAGNGTFIKAGPSTFGLAERR